MTGVPAAEPVLELRQVVKTYGSLRPVRIAELVIRAGERVAIGGLDAGVGEVLVNLVTGASLPDSGEVRVFGRRTDEISNSDDWLDSLDRFGIVSPRGVLLEGSTLQQNLAMPFTLSIDPIPDGVAEQVRVLAAACGIAGRWLDLRAGDVPQDVRVRAHLARALALTPALVVIEHPTASVEPAARATLAADTARACAQHGVTALVLTNDDRFARTVAPRQLTLHGATGQLKAAGKGWFGR